MPLSDRSILYVTHRFPWPPAGGAKVRAWHCVKHLAERNRVTLAAPVRDAAEATAVQGLVEQGIEAIVAPIGRSRAVLQGTAHALTGRPASMGFFDAPGLARRVRRHVAENRPDLIIVHCSSVAPMVADIAGIPKVLDFVDMDSRKWSDYSRFTGFPRSFVYRREGQTLERAEARLARAFDLSLLTTDFELATLREIAGEVPAAVLRNGVDLDHFAPGPEAVDPDLLCFVGRMDYLPNARAMVRFCRRVLPEIRARRPSVKLTITGAEPGPEVRALGALPGVTVTGTVPDIRPFVRAAVATVAPLDIARGTQNKVLESLAMGVPAIVSSLVARGLDAATEPGRHVLVADDPGDFARAALRLLENPAERRAMSSAGRQLAAQRWGWRPSMEELDARLQGLL